MTAGNSSLAPGPSVLCGERIGWHSFTAPCLADIVRGEGTSSESLQLWIFELFLRRLRTDLCGSLCGINETESGAFSSFLGRVNLAGPGCPWNEGEPEYLRAADRTAFRNAGLSNRSRSSMN